MIKIDSFKKKYIPQITFFYIFVMNYYKFYICNVRMVKKSTRKAENDIIYL